MALLLDFLYDALKAAGAPEEQARAAARDVASYGNRFNRVDRDLSNFKWCGRGDSDAAWHVLDAMAGVDRLAGIEARLTTLEAGSQASNAAVQVPGTDQ